MKPFDSNASSADQEIQRLYALQQTAQQPQVVVPPVQQPRMEQRSAAQSEMKQNIPAKGGEIEAGNGSVRLVARSAAVAASSPAEPATHQALKKAIESNDVEQVRRLLETRQIDLNDSDLAEPLPLKFAAQCGCAGAVSLLLQAGADVNATNHDGTTALMGAAQKGNDEVFALLLKA